MMVKWRQILGIVQATTSVLVLTGCPQEEEAPCVDCFDREGYELNFSGLPAGTKPPSAVLFSGWRNGRCQNDVVCTGSPSVFLGDVRWGAVEWSKDCNPDDQEVVVFAGGQEPVLATPVVASGAGLRLSGTSVLVAFNGPFKVDVRVWAVGNPSTSITPAQRFVQLTNDMNTAHNESLTAARIYSEAGTGIDLSFTVDSFTTSALSTTDFDDLYNRASCSLVSKLEVAPKSYDPTQLNVYYVGGVQGAVGRDCYVQGGGVSGQNIIFVQGSNPFSEFRLAHELGHALGLLNSGPLPDGTTSPPGHVDEMYLDTWLAPDNLMDSGPEEVHHLTLGQIYRMHYDKLAWKWRRPGAAAAPNSYPRECQNSPVAGGLCPPLTLHPTRGWE